MLETVISAVADALEKYSRIKAYSAFDNIPIERKTAEPITVISVRRLESTAPIYTDVNFCIPFTASAGISLVAPLDTDMTSLCAFMDSRILPAIARISGVTCSLGDLSFKRDSNISRSVMTIEFKASGIRKYRRRLYE